MNLPFIYSLRLFFSLKGLYSSSTGSKENKSAYPSSSYLVSPDYSASFLITSSLLFIAIKMEDPSLFKNYLVCKLAFKVSFDYIVFLTKVRKSFDILYIYLLI